MKARVFTLPLGADGVFDDTALRDFFNNHDALLVSEHFFVHEGRPTLTLVVQYRAVTEAGRTVAARRGGPDSSVEVPPEARTVYEALRTSRNARGRKDGKPAYVLFTNTQLVAIAVARPASRAALAAVEGVGEARIRDYADEVLAIVAGVPGTPDVPDVQGESDGPESRT